MGAKWDVNSQIWPEEVVFLDAQVLTLLDCLSFFQLARLHLLSHTLHQTYEGGWTVDVVSISATFLKGSSRNDLMLTLFKAKLCIFILS